MPISATSGVVSNIDYQSLVSQLVQVKSQPINRLESTKKFQENVKSAYSSLSSRVQELKTAADTLRKAEGFKVFTTAVSDSTFFDASAGTSATSGTHQVKVSTLAKAHSQNSSGVALSTSLVAAGAGTFAFQVGAGAVQSIAVDATTTLTGLKDAINNLKAGVTASIANTGSGATPYSLVLTSDTTGTTSAVAITTNNTSLTFTDLQAAQDASLTVDGITYTRTSNTVSDVVSGVTLTLKNADNTKTHTLTVNRDTAEIEKRVKAFADKYNSIVNQIRASNRYESKTKTAGVFFGDAVARSIWEDLRRTYTSTVSGLPDTMNRLQHAGIKSDKDGVLSLDTTVLKSALSSNFDGVVKLFEDGAVTKGFGGLVYDLASRIDDSVDGRIKLRQDGITKNIRQMDDSIARRQRELDDYEKRLRTQFSSLEMTLAKLKNQGNYLAGV